MSETNSQTQGRGAEGTFVGHRPQATAGGVADAMLGLRAETATKNSTLRRSVSFPVMLGSLLGGAVFLVLRNFVVDPDLWWHIKTGQDILATHRWPTSDPYSFTAFGQPWIACEWLGEIFLAAVDRAGGARALDLLLILLGTAVMLALYYAGTLRSGNSKAGFAGAAVLLVLANPSFTLRPQMMGYLFLILTIIALESFRQGKTKALWFLPPLLLLWVNTHGSFIVGLGTIFVYWVSGLKEFHLGGLEANRWSVKQRIGLELSFLLCLAVLPLTPYGVEVAAYPFEVALSQPVNVGNILEWSPMPFNLMGGKIFLGLVLLFLVLQVVYRFTWHVAELVLFVFGLAMACLHVRFLLLFVPFFAPLLATMLEHWMPAYDPGKDRYVLNAILMAMLLAAGIRYFPKQADLQEAIAKNFPVHAREYLREHSVPGPVFNTYAFGGYLVYSGNRVFVDGRADLFERGGVLADYLHISLVKPGALAILNGYQVRSCLLARGEPLTVVLAASPDWKRVHFDDNSELFVRQ